MCCTYCTDAGRATTVQCRMLLLEQVNICHFCADKTMESMEEAARGY